MGYIAKQRLLSRRISSDPEALKEMLNILSHQGNANQNDPKIPSYLHQKVIAHVGKDVE